MRSLPLYAAKNQFSELVNQVEQGSEFTITRRGKAVARLMGIDAEPGPSQSAQRSEKALARLAEIRRAIVISGDPKAIAREGLDP